MFHLYVWAWEYLSLVGTDVYTVFLPLKNGGESGANTKSVSSPATKAPKARSPNIVNRRGPRTLASKLCSLESVKNQANLDNEEAHKQLAALSANLEERETLLSKNIGRRLPVAEYRGESHQSPPCKRRFSKVSDQIPSTVYLYKNEDEIT
ncbi:hypothetical protein ACET3Z_001678 [Daucus carota]